MRRWEAGLLAGLAFGLAACTGEDVISTEDRAESRIVIARAERQGCVSVVDAAALTVEPEDGDRQQLQAAFQNGLADFDVEVEIGQVRFTAAILSNNSAVLYAGAVTELIEADDFTIYITPEAAGPVLEVCDDIILLNDGVGTLQIRNPGSEVLDWRLLPPSRELCDNEPCFAFYNSRQNEVEAGTLQPGEQIVLAVLWRAAGPGTYALEVESPVGTVALQIRTN